MPRYRSRFKDILKTAHQKTGKRAVVLIDENTINRYLRHIDQYLWRKRLLEEHHRNILKGFYSTLKGQMRIYNSSCSPMSPSSLKVACPVVSTMCKISAWALILKQFVVSPKKVVSLFAKPIVKLAKESDCSVDEMKQMLKRLYDGCHLANQWQTFIIRFVFWMRVNHVRLLAPKLYTQLLVC